MCVIAVKQAGISLPSKEVLEACFEHNADGAGFMWHEDGKVKYVKGLLTFDEFWGAFRNVFPESLDDTTTKDSTIVLHFRIGTHGSKTAATHTHPFPVTNDFRKMVELKGESEYALMHNGIFRFSTIGENITTYGEGETAETIVPSDTMDYVRDIVYPLSIVEDWFGDPEFNRIIEATRDSSRIVLLDGEGNLQVFGDFIEDEGVLYSNASYKPRPVVVYPSVNLFGDDAAENWWGTRSPSQLSVQLPPSCTKYKRSLFASASRRGYMPVEDLYILRNGARVQPSFATKSIRYNYFRDGMILYGKYTKDVVFLYEYSSTLDTCWYICSAELLSLPGGELRFKKGRKEVACSRIID